MRYVLAFLFAFALLLPGCQSGPGAACDECAVAEAEASGPFAQAAAAAASGGQKASNQPVQTDPGARGFFNPSNRGQSQTASNTTAETRSQAGAPSVNQGLVLPTQADAATGGGVSPVVASLQAYVDDLRAALKLALMSETSDPGRINDLMRALNDAIGQMAQAQASARGVTNHTYNFDGARIVQSVANGSNSGDGTTAIDPKAAAAVGAPLQAAARSVMESGTDLPAEKLAAPDGPAPLVPEAPELPELPPVGGVR